MSEFACRNGHLMPSTWGNECRICGSRLHTMDGRTHNQLIAEERNEEERPPENEAIE